MGDLDSNEELNMDTSNITVEDNIDSENNSTDITEYKEVEEPCVALTIIGENRLTDTEIFVRRGLKYSIRAFFSAIALTIMNLFI